MKADVHREKEDRFPEEAEAWDEEDLGLDWDEAEFRRIASQLRTERGTLPL
jgi:hypothetical protein